MKGLIGGVFAAFFCAVVLGCGSSVVLPLDITMTRSITNESSNDEPTIMTVPKVTGSVEIMWNGGGSSGNGGGLQEPKRAFAEFDAHEGTESKPPKGEFRYIVTGAAEVVHREIIAEVVDVYVDEEAAAGWFLARVVYDTKENDGADGVSCDGGCADGCAGDQPTEEGCDSGCTDGCSGGDEGGSCAEGGCGGGSATTGKYPRTGQWIAVKVTDGGSPGASNDAIRWKWLSSDSEQPTVDPDVDPWLHLCPKTIIEGNLTVHFQPGAIAE